MPERPEGDSPQTVFVKFLENCELSTEVVQTASRRKAILGVVLTLVGIMCASVVLLQNFDGPERMNIAIQVPELWKTILLALSAIFCGGGILFIIAGFSSEQYRAVNVRIHRYGPVATVWFQGLVFILVAASAILVSILIADEGILKAELGIIVPLIAFMLFMVYAIYELGSGPVNLGVSSIRRRFKARRTSAVLETLSLGAVAVCFMVAMASMHDSPMSMALGVISALVGYFSFKMKVLEDAFSETFRLFYEIRNRSWRQYIGKRDKDLDSTKSAELICDVIDSYRDLLISMQRTPVFSRRPVSVFGLRMLCQLADSREAHVETAEWLFDSGLRKELAEEILSMSDDQFSMASAIVFDAYGELLAGRNSPPLISHGDSSNEDDSESLKVGFDSDLARAVDRAFVGRFLHSHPGGECFNGGKS